jgi:methyl-accepting chemotaxis protein
MRISTERAHTTLKVARDAGDSMENITAAMSQISDRNMVIASASEEQAQVAREVDRNLVNTVTCPLKALREQTRPAQPVRSCHGLQWISLR